MKAVVKSRKHLYIIIAVMTAISLTGILALTLQLLSEIRRKKKQEPTAAADNDNDDDRNGTALLFGWRGGSSNKIGNVSPLQDNTCGGTNGYTCPSSELKCCSQYGWCGNTAAYCVGGLSAFDFVPTTTSASPTTTTTTTTTTQPGPTSTSTCSKSLLVDDFLDPNRLTFLFYNGMRPPLPSSDDGTMGSLSSKYGARTLVLNPNSRNSYFYTSLGCLAASEYEGISLSVSIPAGASFSVGLEHFTSPSPGCNSGVTNFASVDLVGGLKVATGSMVRVTIPFSQFAGVNFNQIKSIQLVSFTKPSVNYVIGPISLVCKGVPAVIEAIPSPIRTTAPPLATNLVSGTAGNFVIESFAFVSQTANSAGGGHGSDDTVPVTFAVGSMTINPKSPDGQFFTQLGSGACANVAKYSKSFLHLALNLPAGQDFDIALQQHNFECDESKRFPVTYDDVQASEFFRNGHIYIPMNYFGIDLAKVSALVLKSFKSTSPVKITKVDIVNSLPSGRVVRGKPVHSPLIFTCKVPNTIAFCIDDGIPALASRVMEIFANANAKATFFSLGLPLLDPTNGLATVYKKAQQQGHQMEQHSLTHPYSAILPDWAMDYQLIETNKIFQSSKQFNLLIM